MADKIVLAYSGGLDTSVAIRWLQEHYGAEIATLTMDLGGKVDLEEARQRAIGIGAVRADVIDAREEFINEYVWPALQAGALYEGVYPLATALGRPLIAKHLVRIALEEQAFAIAHGCTGKGNDQVRFDVSAAALAPQIKVVAPAREWNMTRDEEIAYANEHRRPARPQQAQPLLGGRESVGPQHRGGRPRGPVERTPRGGVRLDRRGGRRPRHPPLRRD